MTENIDAAKQQAELQKRRAAFDALREMEDKLGITDDETVDYTAAVKELEARFPGLTITSPFQGAMPIRAYGVLGSCRFYFRFRRDTATLTVAELEDVDNPHSLPADFHPLFLENKVTVKRENVTGEPLNGWLSPAEAVEVFTALMNDLPAAV